MKKFDRFQKGSACYTCECCGKQTRDTGAGEAGCMLCAPCYELGGIQNEHADNCEHADITTCPRHAAEVQALVAAGAKL